MISDRRWSRLARGWQWLRSGRFIRSRVGRRMYLLFVTCTALPIAVLALLALSQVTQGLEEQARERLRRTVKVAGMAIVDRLQLAEMRLRTVEGREGQAEALTFADPDRPGRVPFLRSGLWNPAAPTSIASTGDTTRSDTTEARSEERIRDSSRSRCSDEELLRLLSRSAIEGGARFEADQAALFRCDEPDRSHLVLIVQVDGPTPQLAWGELSPEFLFGREDDPAEVDGPGLVVLDEAGQVVRARSETAPLVDRLRSVTEDRAAMNLSWRTASDEYIAQSWTLFAKYDFDCVWTLALSEERSAFLAPIARFRTGFALVAVLSVLLASYVSLVQIRRELIPIDKLHDATLRVAAGDFQTQVTVSTRDEFEDLARSFNEMSAKVSRSLDLRRRLIDLGIRLSRKNDTAALLDVVLENAPILTAATRVGVALFSHEESVVEVQLADASGRRIVLDLTDTSPVVGRDLANADPEIARMAWLALMGLDSAEQSCDLRTLSLLADDGVLIGVLALGRPVDAVGAPCASFSDEQLALGRLLAAQTAAVLARTHLLQSFKAMFEGMTRLITVAIDEKSPYTYGHCQRVPILTMMLANAACATEAGPLADLSLTPDELYELEVAALLHDCGKVTTPVHVVDKATKLQTLFDRIELVEARFEIVRRELLGEKTTDLEARLADLDGDVAFLRTCNRGVERLPQGAPDRVRAIAAKYGWRNAAGWNSVLSDDEVSNLCIVRGTLNESERLVIESHVLATRKMLQALPYPRHLRRVPEIAAAHHERLDGSGYPDGARGPQLSMQARILAIADVFEALTAKDRPYKDGRTLSEALSILEQMKNDGYIDPSLHEVFLRQRVYAEYAREYLDPAQIDLPIDLAESERAAA